MHTIDKFYINGQWQAPMGTGTIEVINPTTEQPCGSVPSGDANDVDVAVAAAKAAFPAWSQTSSAERAGFIAQLTAKIEENKEKIGALVAEELGMPLGLAVAVQAGLPTGVMASYMELPAEMDKEEQLNNSLIIREAVGICGFITPWNFPLHQVVAKVAPALAAGCTMVLKPSSETPLTAFLFAGLIEEVGLPAGVFNIVTGPGRTVGEAMARHPDIDMISITGSTAAGIRVAELAASTAATVAVGGAFEDGVFMGPMVSRQQQETVRKYIKKGIEEGATLVTGGVEMPAGISEGFFVQPTVFADVKNTMTIAQEEIFGPVLVIIPYDNEEEAIAIANDSPFGLSGAVWGRDVERAKSVAKKIRTGQIAINGGEFNVSAPFGGYKQSGNGRELGTYGLHEYIELKSLQL